MFLLRSLWRVRAHTYLALQVEGERVSAGMVKPVRHAVGLQGLEPLEVQETVVVRIARGVSLPAAAAAEAAAMEAAPQSMQCRQH